MSLELAAQHLASRGRKGDTSLVHMAPQEVAGLQALAKAHGGSLTLNPDTGLPEANFLKNLLPTLIGAGISIASGGTLTPLMAAGITGAGYGMATGSLQKGLMAGLGAYGGAGLAGGLTAAAGTVGAEAGLAGSAMGPQTAAQMAGQLGSGFQANMAAQGVTPTAQFAAGVPTTTPVPTITPVADRFAQAGKGFGALGTEAGREAFMGNAASKGVAASGVGGGMGLMKSAYSSAMPLMIQEPPKQAPKGDEKMHEYDFDIGRIADPNAGYTGAATGERGYFDPRFTRRAADGGLMGLGNVQAMSDRNMAEMMAANGGQGYAVGGSLGGFFRSVGKLVGNLRDIPDRRKSRYVVDDPITTMPVIPAPITAMPNNSAVRPVEEHPFYTMSGQSGDAFKYLMGEAPASRGIAPTVPGGVSGSGGFLGGTLGGVTGFASPEGIVDAATGRVTPWSASNPKPTGGGFFGNSAALPAGDTIEYDYTFDPVTGRYSRTAKPIDSAAAAAATAHYTPFDFGGGDSFGGFGESVASNNAPVSSMGSDSGFGGDGANAGVPGGGNAAGGAGNSGDGGTGDSSTATDGGGASAGASDGSGPGAGAGTGGASAGDSGDGGTGAASSAGDGGGASAGDGSGPGSGDGDGGYAKGGLSPDARYHMARGGLSALAMAQGGHAAYGLGDYSDGGRLLKGPGDGVSDSIPATIANKRPARLADGEFVVPARIVSELGNGSTEAGARKLYAMMDRVQKARTKSIGKNRVAVNSRAEKLLPA